MAEPTDRKEWLSLHEASAQVGVSATTLRSWADHGRVRAFRTPGGHRRFHQQDLADLATSRQVSTASVPVKVLAHAALGRTRFELTEGSLPRTDWYKRFPGGAREEHRELGRRVVTALSEWLPGPEAEAILQSKAVELGRAYCVVNQKYGIALTDAVRAFSFFRDTFVRSLAEFAKTTPAVDALTLLLQVSRFVDGMLLAMVEQYGPSANKQRR